MKLLDTIIVGVVLIFMGYLIYKPFEKIFRPLLEKIRELKSNAKRNTQEAIYYQTVEFQ